VCEISHKTILVGAGVVLAGWVGWGIYSTKNAKSVPYEQLRTLNRLLTKRVDRPIILVVGGRTPSL